MSYIGKEHDRMRGDVERMAEQEYGYYTSPRQAYYKLCDKERSEGLTEEEKEDMATYSRYM